MRWIAVFACLFMTVAVGAWEKIDQMDGGIVFSGSLTGLKRQSFSLGDEVQLPRLSGKVSCFAIQPSPFLPNQTGDVRVYQGTASGDEKVRLHLVVSSDRFFAQILSSEGIEYIDPIDVLTVKVYQGMVGIPPNVRCLTEPSPTGETVLARQSSSEVIRTFRLAAAATAEFTAFHGTREAAYLSLVTALNRAHGIFERELGVRFQLVPQTEGMVFTDPASDPYSTNEPDYQLLRDAQGAFDLHVGTANYDLGIVLTRGVYGLAYIRSVCDPERKGSSCVGLPEPAGDAFHVSLVTHELAHQFGANHTFNSPTGFCAERRNEWTAFEPGAGSTIMSYASLPCEGDSFQAHNDDYFHSENLEEIGEFLNSPQASCAQVDNAGNQTPSVYAGEDHHIPILTPFTLTASGSDPDGDALTFCWEQRDLGPAQVLGAPDNGLSPLFRSYPPSPNPTRFFPALPYILSGEDPPFEQLPSTQRDLRFRVTVRDSRNLGAYSWDEAYLGVINLGGPFQVTSHSQAVTLSDATTEVRWDVAGTTSPPIAVSHVRITLSADGGETFDIVLAASTPNDGAEIVTMPFVNAANARIKVEAIGNVFFSINRAPLTLMRQGTVLRNIEWRRMGDGLQVLWRSVPGNAYRIERTATLESSDWKEAQRIVAETEESSVTLPIVTPGAAFYRVVQE